MGKFTQLFIPFVLIIFLFMYIKRGSTEVTMVKSKTDGQNYLVQNKKDKQQAAELLANIKIKLKNLVSKLSTEHNNHKDCGNCSGIKRLTERFQPDRISEGSQDKSYTTYTLNKGEKIVFCLRTRDTNDNLHGLNLLAFVAIHELAHIMTLSTGHTPEFQKNFEFLLTEAVKFGLYNPENFRQNPTNYCGIPVTDTPLSDDVFA